MKNNDFHKALLYLETDFEMTENQEDMTSASICIQPSSGPYCDSDRDLGDEVCINLSKLSQQQLLAPAHLEIKRLSIDVENAGKAVAVCTSPEKNY